MTGKQQQTRQRLEARKAELMASAKDIDAELRQPTNPDFEEHAIEIEDNEVLEGLGQAALDEVAQIDTAITRIDNGIYDTCVSCHNPIGEARLEAVPYATRCMECVEE